MNLENQLVEHVEDSNTSDNPHFQEILNARVSRRSVVRGGIGMTAAMMLGGACLVGCSDDNDDPINTPPTKKPELKAPATINLTPVPHSKKDQVVVPEQYQVEAFLPVGMPLISGLSDWSDTQQRAGESFELRVGDNHDGLWFYGLKDGKLDNTVSDHGLLVINHEYVEVERLHLLGGYTRKIANPVDKIYENQRLSDDVRREVNTHGVGVYEVKRKKDLATFELVKDSKFNRRFTSATEVDFSGPAAGHDLLKTKFDPTGKTTRGINNQCGSGPSPWGTYLTVEENFTGVFARRTDDAAKVPAHTDFALTRYGQKAGSTGFDYLWHTPALEEQIIPDEFSRWDVSSIGATALDDYRNALNTFGWIVEVDPFDPTSRAVKRTALGRFAHENCGYAPVKAGKPVVLYMGDDARGEYVYKFVSKAVWNPADANGGLKAGTKYLDEGTLYVAKFSANGTEAYGLGEWVELTYGINGLNSSNIKYPFSSQADVMVFTRLAADSVGATKMDRPEWVNASPITGEVYLTLTNSNAANRGGKTDPANPRDYDNNDDGKLDGNPNGHVIRWREDNGNHAALKFQWDVYAFGAPFDLAAANLSGLTAENDFSSPDGLVFDPRGVMWIQTDDGAYLKRTNCMMLVALPGQVGDGTSQQVGTVTTHIGAKPTANNLARFLTGPLEAEITGVAFTPDLKTFFVSIQHPGENGNRKDGFNSHWPDSQTNPSSKALPRSALAVITRKDGGVVLG